jgi:exodeoxyribonuclease VII large subunit
MGRRERLAWVRQRLDARHPARRAHELRERLLRVDAALGTLLLRRIQSGRGTLVALARALHAVGPLATLARGYAILRDREGRIVRSAGQVAVGDPVDARVADGSLGLVVRTIELGPPGRG